MKRPLAGLFLPVTTPFGEDGETAPDRLARQIGVYREFRLSGIVLFGTSGEGPLIDSDEEADLLAAARAEVPREWSLIAQVGKESLRATIASGRRAAEAGADALLCLPPRYYPAGEAALAAFYRGVREAVGLSLLAYHIPQRTHVALPAELLVRLAREGTLCGIKDSAGDLELQRTLRREAPDGFAILNGRASTTAAALAAGADGAVLAVADAAPEAALALLEAHAAGREERVRPAQSAILPLADCLGPRYGVPGIKAALDARGWPGGGLPRPPLEPLGAGPRAEIAEALSLAGVELPTASVR